MQTMVRKKLTITESAIRKTKWSNAPLYLSYS